MRRTALRISGLVALTLLLAGCDKCGEWLKINSPQIPSSCSDTAPPPQRK